MKELCAHQVVFLTLNSSTYQNLFSIIKNAIVAAKINEDQIPLIYISENKIKAFEDCINFCPQLFRLTKSIVVSEPLHGLLDMIRQNAPIIQSNKSLLGDITDSSRLNSSGAS